MKQSEQQSPSTDYQKHSREAEDAWMNYKGRSIEAGCPPVSFSDFLAGFNAGSERCIVLAKHESKM